MSTALERYEFVEGYESASLPVRYEEARKHLAECERLDECKAWKDKAEALRSYARQAHDDQLYRMALKIQNRARVRMGELIREVEKATGTHRKTGGPPSLSRRAAAKAAGLSIDEENEAKAMSRVPEPVLEEMIERGATATEIAEEGRNYDDGGRPRDRFVRCVHCRGQIQAGESHNCLPDGYQEATRLIGDLGRLRSLVDAHEPRRIALACTSHERSLIRSDAAAVSAWLEALMKNIQVLSTSKRKK